MQRKSNPKQSAARKAAEVSTLLAKHGIKKSITEPSKASLQQAARTVNDQLFYFQELIQRTRRKINSSLLDLEQNVISNAEFSDTVAQHLNVLVRQQKTLSRNLYLKGENV